MPNLLTRNPPPYPKNPGLDNDANLVDEEQILEALPVEKHLTMRYEIAVARLDDKGKDIVR